MQCVRCIAPEKHVAPALVQLLPCHRPTGSLESAPRTSLRVEAEHGQGEWEGFWCDDERYYARCARPDGSEQWYRIEDERGVLQFRPRPLRGRAPGARSLTTARLARSGPPMPPRHAMLVSARHGGRAMLVGTWRRRGARAGQGEAR